MSSYEDFIESAKIMGGSDIDPAWLKELWDGADGDANRALNHLIDTPPDKFRRGGSSGGGGKSGGGGDSFPRAEKPRKSSLKGRKAAHPPSAGGGGVVREVKFPPGVPGPPP